MKEKQNKINRRNFLKTVGAAGVSSVFASGCADTNDPCDVEPNEAPATSDVRLPQVPRRRLGKTGVEVPILTLGTMFDLMENQIVLRKCIDWGATYWDTAYGYSGGNSELGIGRFLKRTPELREKLFIVSKASGARSIDDIEQRLQESLERMNTKYIDLYYGIHVLNDPKRLDDDLRKWAESAKKRKLIKHFGFSTHKDMAPCLAAASKLDWIDAVLTTYNFRVMNEPELQDAVEACHQADIGLTAMKTQGKASEADQAKKLTEHFLQKGFTEGQAKIKLVLEDKRFASAAVRMENVALLTTNVAAVLDKTELTRADKNVFTEYARETCAGYCAGCANICENALPDVPCISEVMRYLMYYNSYGDRTTAKNLFAQLPADVRSRLLATDFSPAERLCPQRIPIGKFVAEAVTKLA